MRSIYREDPCKSALNPVRGMGFAWTLNPYMGCEHRCAFCYVRFYERRADRPPGEHYGDEIRIKTNVASVLSEELARPSWKRELVAVGGATDPYQPAEARYKLTRACVQELGRARTPFQVITRAPLIARDLDVLQEASRRAEVSISFSVPTLDEAVWRRTEPRTPHPRRRLEALAKLIDGGGRAGVGVAPTGASIRFAPPPMRSSSPSSADGRPARARRAPDLPRCKTKGRGGEPPRPGALPWKPG